MNKIKKIEASSGNVYADLGMAGAEEVKVKAQLASKIGEIIKSRKWTEQQATDVLGIPQSKLSKMLRGQFRGVGEEEMLDCLTRLGQPIPLKPMREMKLAEGRKGTISKAALVSHFLQIVSRIARL